MTRRTIFPVPRVDGIELDFRPASYWDPIDPVSAITRNIKGQRRREMARDFLVGNAAERFGPIASLPYIGLGLALGSLHRSVAHIHQFRTRRGYRGTFRWVESLEGVRGRVWLEFFARDQLLSDILFTLVPIVATISGAWLARIRRTKPRSPLETSR